MRPSLKRMHMIALGAVVLVGAGVACIDGHLDAGVTAWVSASSLYSSWVGLLLRGRGQGVKSWTPASCVGTLKRADRSVRPSR